uniref:Uncharacterized protein n=1 Tax=Arundo donax TaxID=35708 RepID=A0A0A9GND3_ARUDO
MLQVQCRFRKDMEVQLYEMCLKYFAVCTSQSRVWLP